LKVSTNQGSPCCPLANPGWRTTGFIPIEPGKEYQASVFTFTPDGGVGHIPAIQFFKADGTFLGTIGATGPSGITDPNGTWVKKTYTFDLSTFPTLALATKVRLGVKPDIFLTKGTPTTVFFDDVFFGLVIPTLSVEIDIKPGSDPNCFNNDGNGVIPVAILGAADFDVTQVDPSTVQLEGLSVASQGKSGKLMAHVEDVNGDGFDDLVVQIEDVDGTFTSGNGTATLTGNLFDGTPLEGSDNICVVPSAPPPPIEILFDNGSSSGPQSNIGNSVGVQELFEDFTVDQNWVITEIHWEEHDHNQATYLSTEVLIFGGLPFSGPPVFASTIVANRTPNSTGTILGNWDGFDYRITGVSINLPPGTYWIGLNQNFQGIRSGWDTTTGGPNTIPGFRIVNINFPAPGLVNGGNLAFTLWGQLP
jgi:hypothetical protein